MTKQHNNNQTPSTKQQQPPQTTTIHGTQAILTSEGNTQILLPKDHSHKKAFFNPVAALSRDLSVLYLLALPENQLTICDALAGTGVRGIRLANETSKVHTLWLVDRSHEATDWIHRNVKLNNLENLAFVFEKDANVFFYEHSGFFHFIDIDPFGSPIYFIEGATRALKRTGYLAITATDQKALMGFAPDATLRRYGIHAIKTDMRHEIGLRNLIATIALTAAKQEYIFQPHIAFHYRHYYRVMGKLEKAHARTAQHLRQNLGIIHYCPYCLDRLYATEFAGNCSCGRPFRTIYPTWIGPLHEPSIIQTMLNHAQQRQNQLAQPQEAQRLLTLILQETNAPVYNLHDIASRYRLSLPTYQWLLNRLPNSSRVHHAPYAIRTSARIQELISWMKKWIPPKEWRQRHFQQPQPPEQAERQDNNS